jgi:hypothetical protein
MRKSLITSASRRSKMMFRVSPPHVLQKVDERIARAVKKNAALDADRYETLAGKLEYFDLRELQDTMTGKAPWAYFEPRFGTKEALILKFDQLAELRSARRFAKKVKRQSSGLRRYSPNECLEDFTRSDRFLIQRRRFLQKCHF